MTERLAVALEGTGRKVFASALEWPGWPRSGKTAEAAIEALLAYASRYGPGRPGGRLQARQDVRCRRRRAARRRRWHGVRHPQPADEGRRPPRRCGRGRAPRLARGGGLGGVRRGRRRRGRGRWADALAIAGDDPLLRADIFNEQALFAGSATARADDAGRHEDAWRGFQESVALRRAERFWPGVGAGLLTLAEVARDRGRPREARRYLRQAKSAAIRGGASAFLARAEALERELDSGSA